MIVSKFRIGRGKIPLLMALAWLVSVATASFLPISVKLALHTEGRFHSWDHLCVFAVGGVILSTGSTRRAGQVCLLICGVATGFCLELTQHLVYQSDVELIDMLMDTIGVGVGVLTIVLWRLSSVHRRRGSVPAKRLPRATSIRSG